MSAIAELVGAKVKGKSGDVETSSFTGEGKVVGKIINYICVFNLPVHMLLMILSP